MHTILAMRDARSLRIDVPALPLGGRSVLTPSGILVPYLLEVGPRLSTHTTTVDEIGVSIIDPATLLVTEHRYPHTLPAAQGRGYNMRRSVTAQTWCAPWAIFRLQSVAKSYEPNYLLALNPATGEWALVDAKGSIHPLGEPLPETLEHKPLRGIDAFAWTEGGALLVHEVSHYVGDGDGETWPKESKTVAERASKACAVEDPGLMVKPIMAPGGALQLKHPSTPYDAPVSFEIQGMTELVTARSPEHGVGITRFTGIDGRVIRDAAGAPCLFVHAAAVRKDAPMVGVLATFAIPDGAGA